MIMNQDDARRYEWLRTKFACTDIKDDGTYKPVFAYTMPSATTLDASIDKAMGVTPTHEPLEPVFTVDEVAEMLSSNIQDDDGGPHVWLNDNRRLNVGLLIPTLEIKAELRRMEAGE